MKIFTCILLFLFLFLLPQAGAQSKANDNIDHEQGIARNDTLELIKYIILAEKHAEINPDSAIYFADKVITLSRKYKFRLDEVSALGQKGYALLNLGNYPRSLQTLLSAISIAEDPKSEKNVLPDIYPGFDELNNRSAPPHHQRLDKLARIHQYIGILYGNANDHKKEKFHYLQAKQLAEQTGNLPLLSIINGVLGRVYLVLKQTDSALIVEQEAYDQAIKSDYRKYRGSVLLNLARAHSTMGNNQLATEYFKKALTASMEENYLRGVVAANLSLADLYIESGKRDSGLYFINTAMNVAQQLNAPSLELRSYKALAAFYRHPANNDSIVKYQGLIIRINDSLFNSKQAQEFQNIDFDAQQRLQEKEAAEQAYQYRLRMYGLLTGLGIFLLLAIILWRNNRNKQKAYSLLIKQKQETDFQKSKVEQTLSELKSAQAQLIQSEKMASLGELTAGIAHEIQNPLNFVNNFSEVNKELLVEMKDEIDKGNLNEVKAIANDVIANQEKINHHGKRADAIVKGMLQHSRTSSGQKEPTDINALCDEYLRLAYHGLRAKDKSFNAKFETDFDNSIGKINVVPQDIGRVMLNLINNAFYAVSEKKKQSGSDYEPTVSIRTRKSNGTIEIRVSDNGNGIPAKLLDKIFQPFFTTKPTGQGTGLGLSLAYDIITKGHGGKLKVETTEEKFTEFIIKLP